MHGMDETRWYNRASGRADQDYTIDASLIPVGRGLKLGMGWIGKWLGKAAKTGFTNSQLVQKSATLAERAIGGQGPVAGTAKHKYATQLLDRYQSIYGHKGLFPNYSFNNGVGNRGILDVLDKTNGVVYDFKFGKAVMSPAQYTKYFNNFGLSIQVIRP